MKATLDIEIFPRENVCTGLVDEDCRFWTETEDLKNGLWVKVDWCELFSTELETEPFTETGIYAGRPMRCEACKKAFK